MREIPNANHTLGLELTSTCLKGAELSIRKNKPFLIRAFEIKIEKIETQTENVKQLYTETERKNLSKLTKETLPVTVLDTAEVLVRKLELDLVKEKDIDAVLGFQTEPLLPYPMEQGLIDRIIVSNQTGESIITVVAARKDYVANHIEQWRSLEVEPELITCVPAALAEFSKYFCPATGAHLITHLGEDTTTFIVANMGKLISAQSISLGIKTLLKAYNEDSSTHPGKSPSDFFGLDFGALKEDQTPSLIKAIETMKLEITKVSFSLIKKIREYEITDLFTTGEGAILQNLPQILYQNIKMTHLEAQIDPDFNCFIDELHTYSISIGAALSGMPLSTTAINFRQNEYAYPHPWKRIQKPLAIYYALCIGLAFAFYLFGNAYIHRQEDLLKYEYVDLLASMKRPYSLFETEFKDSLSRGKNNPETPLLDVLALSQADIIQRLDFLNKELNAKPDLFPLLPNVPRVSDVLAWMTKLANTSSTEEFEDANIQLTSFNYKMMKRPEFSKKKEVYQAKVELEFTTGSPKNAREFHDALVAPNDFVDPNNEIKWSSERGKYRISFFLKDKTYYPSKGATGA
jgi:type IV pilus assembly protein PilM